MRPPCSPSTALQYGHSIIYPFALAMIPIVLSLLVAYGTDGSGNSGSVVAPAPQLLIEPTALPGALPGIVNNRLALSVNAASPIPMARIELFAAGAATGISATLPYAIEWDSSTIADDSHSIIAGPHHSTNATSNAAAAMTMSNLPATEPDGVAW